MDLRKNFKCGDRFYQIRVQKEKSLRDNSEIYDLDCIVIKARIRHRKRMILAQLINNNLLCEDIVLQILSFNFYDKPVNIGEYVTCNFVSDHFVKILMTNHSSDFVSDHFVKNQMTNHSSDFVSDHFVKILMTNHSSDLTMTSFIKSKQLFIDTLKNGSRITDEKTETIFKCHTHSIYPAICKDLLRNISFKKLTNWGELKRSVIETYPLFYH